MLECTKQKTPQFLVSTPQSVRMKLIRPFINILLFLAYFIFFGRYSIKKYLKGDVVINRNVEMTDNISPPGTVHIILHSQCSGYRQKG